MQILRNIRNLGAAVAIGALLAACGSGTGAPTEDADQPADGEPLVSVTFDGEPVEFEEVHCGFSPGNEGRARLFAIYDGGEFEINADEDPERGVNVWIEPEDGSDYFDREPHGATSRCRTGTATRSS